MADRSPGQLITKQEQREHGLSRKEARRLEKEERKSGELLLGRSGPTVENAEEQPDAPNLAETGKQPERKTKKKRNTKTVGGFWRNSWKRKRVLDLDAELSATRRTEILEQKIAEAQGLGFNLDNRGDTWASMTSPAGDPIGTGGTVMAIATLGLSLMTAKARRGRENDKSISISVRPNGMVAITGDSWMLAGEDYTNVPEAEDA